MSKCEICDAVATSAAYCNTVVEYCDDGQCKLEAQRRARRTKQEDKPIR